MSESTGGELLARCLAAEGVRFVFGLPSPEVDPFLAALEPQGIRFDAVEVRPGPRGPEVQWVRDAFDADGLVD